MRRVLSCSTLLLCVALAVPALRADVKTTEKSSFKLEGMMGAMINRMAGGADGVTTTVAVKGNRMSRMTTSNGQIVDLAEEKIYSVDVKKKEYTVMTFAQMREQMEKLKADMAKQQPPMSPEEKKALQDAGKQMEFDVNVSETGQKKDIAGQNTREVILTLTMRQQGRKLEESGGMVLTNTMWLAPRVAALDELREFTVKFVKAAYGEALTGLNPQQMGAMSAMIPGMAQLMARMAAETQKLQGTPLSTLTVMETVKSPDQAQPAQPSSGGGIGGMLARRMARGQSQPRTKTMTITSDIMSIATGVTTEDVTIPAAFKLKD